MARPPRAPNLGGHTQRCLNAMRNALGRDLAEDEADKIAMRLQSQIARRRLERGSASDAILYREASQQIRLEYEADRALVRRNRNINVVRFDTETNVLSGFANKAEGLHAMLGGGALYGPTNSREAGARFSIDYQGQAIFKDTFGAFVWRLRSQPQDQLLATFQSRTATRDIARELEAMRPGATPSSVTGNLVAFDIARAMFDTNEDMRLRSNRAGAWIDFSPGWFIKQEHDAAKMRRAGFDEWRRFIEPLLDDRTFERRESRVDQVRTLRTQLQAQLNQINGNQPRINALFATASAELMNALKVNREAGARARGVAGAAKVAQKVVPGDDVTRAKARDLADQVAGEREARAGDMEVAAGELAEGAQAERAASQASIESLVQGATELRDERAAKWAESMETIRALRPEHGETRGQREARVAEKKRLRDARDKQWDEYSRRLAGEEDRINKMRGERDTEAGEFRSAIRQAEKEGLLNKAAADALDGLARRIERMGRTTDEVRLQQLTDKVLRDYARALANMDVSARQAMRIEQHMGPAIVALNQIADNRRLLTQRLIAAEKASDDLAGKGRVNDNDEFFREVWDAIQSGRNRRPTGAVDWVAGIGGIGNLGQSISRERVLHFRNSDAWLDYHEQFGEGSFNDAFVRGTIRSSRNIAMLERLGPNPQEMFDRLRQWAMEEAHGDHKQLEQLRSKDLDHLWSQLDGETSRVEKDWLANLGLLARGWQVITKLGSMLFASFPDTVTYASEVQHQGGNLFTGYGQAAGNVFRGRGRGETRLVADRQGAGLEGMVGAFGATYGSMEGGGGLMAKAVELFYTASFQSWWTDIHKQGMSFNVTRGWAQDRGLGWAQLDHAERQMFRDYGITEKEWDLFRVQQVEMARGREYLIPAALREAPHADLEVYAGRALTALEAQRYRDRIGDRFATLLHDRADFAIVTPGVAEKAAMYGGWPPGSLKGEANRLFWQFKAFPVSLWKKLIVGRGWRGADSAGAAITGLTSLVMQLTVAGYVVGVLKDLSRGKEPADPTKWQTWASAAMAGGGAGLYGDFFLGEYNRFGKSWVETFAGPTIGGLISDIGTLRSETMKGEATKAEWLRFGAANIPFANLFYLKGATDYMLLYPLYDQLNPGYLGRMERRLHEREGGRGYWLSPSTFRGTII